MFSKSFTSNTMGSLYKPPNSINVRLLHGWIRVKFLPEKSGSTLALVIVNRIVIWT